MWHHWFAKKKYLLIAAGLLILMFGLEIHSSRQESQTVDEGVHLAAGYSYLTRSDFRMNPEHPPFLKQLSALPLTFISTGDASPFDDPSWANTDQWRFAKAFIYEHQLEADTVLFLGRLASMLLSLLLGLFLFRWTTELFGARPALVVLALYALSPTVISHARYVTTDLAVSTFFFITVYYFYKYLKFGGTRHLLYTAIFFGVAQASKFSAVILVVILPLLYLIAALRREIKTSSSFICHAALTGVTIAIAAIIIVWGSYHFQIERPIDDPQIQDLYAQRQAIEAGTLAAPEDRLTQWVVSFTDPETSSGQFIESIARTPLPAYSYLRGFIQLYLHNYNGHTSYLVGEYTDFGWWWYFPYAFLVKTPLTTQLLLLLTLITALITYCRAPTASRSIPLYVFFIALPPLLHLLVSINSHLNLGVRHILIIYPFIFLGIGWLLRYWFSHPRRRVAYAVVTLLLLFYFVSFFSVYPHVLAYFNEAAGGPGNGPRLLVDSNIDWGQDAKKLKRYMDERGIDHVCLSYFGQAKLEYYGIDYRYLPDVNDFTTAADVNCVVAISVTSLLSREREYGWLLDYEPDAKIGYSIYVYDLRRVK